MKIVKYTKDSEFLEFEFAGEKFMDFLLKSMNKFPHEINDELVRFFWIVKNAYDEERIILGTLHLFNHKFAPSLAWLRDVTKIIKDSDVPIVNVSFADIYDTCPNIISCNDLIDGFVIRDIERAFYRDVVNRDMYFVITNNITENSLPEIINYFKNYMLNNKI